MTLETRDHSSIYEQPIWDVIGGDVLRPVGLALTERALALCRRKPGARLLDIGCGGGAAITLAVRRGYACVGVDVSAALLRHARAEYADLALLQASAERLPLAAGTVDVVLAECSLSVVADPDQALEEIGRVLVPGGALVMSDIYARNPDGLATLRRLSIDTCLSGARSEQQIGELLQAHWFRLAIWEDHSDALKLFASLMAAACGRAAAFCGESVGVDPFDLQLALARARLGYYLLVATKQAC